MWRFIVPILIVAALEQAGSFFILRAKKKREQLHYLHKLSAQMGVHTKEPKQLFSTISQNTAKRVPYSLQFEQLKQKYNIPKEVGLGQLIFIQVGLVFIGWNLSGFLHISLIPLLVLSFLVEVIMVVIVLRKRRLLDQLDKSFPSLLDAFASMYSVHPDLKHTFQASHELIAEPVLVRFLTELTALTQVGVPSVKALQLMSRRWSYPPLAFLVSSIRVHESSGGNLAQLFRMMANSLRRHQDSTKAMNAVLFQNKVSGIVVSALVPVVLLLSISLSKNYRMVMSTESFARGLVVAALVWWLVGALVMYKTLRVRV